MSLISFGKLRNLNGCKTIFETSVLQSGVGFPKDRREFMAWNRIPRYVVLAAG
jgi:hypothetical protein